MLIAYRKTLIALLLVSVVPSKRLAPDVVNLAIISPVALSSVRFLPAKDQAPTLTRLVLVHFLVEARKPPFHVVKLRFNAQVSASDETFQEPKTAVLLNSMFGLTVTAPPEATPEADGGKSGIAWRSEPLADATFAGGV